MIRAAFFDIDGTLLSFKTHKLAASTKAALIELRNRGVKCFIASGRPEYQLPPCIRHGVGALQGLRARSGCGVCQDSSRESLDTVTRVLRNRITAPTVPRKSQTPRRRRRKGRVARRAHAQ